MVCRTAVVFSQKYYRHNPGRTHPESAKRLYSIITDVEKHRSSEKERWRFIEPVKASIAEVELVHGLEYIKLVEAVCRNGGGLLDLGDTVVSPESYEVALYAVGGTLRAVKLVAKNEFENAFAFVRPPGHHASKFRACGFCIFNNVAISAEYLVRKLGLERVVILDIDAHHGNGTQESFYQSDRVLYVSLHEDPTGFPGTGFAGEIGEAAGLGYTVNVPLPYGTSDQVYLKAFDEIVDPIVRDYAPQFLLVSAGLDGHYSDPVGQLALSASCYGQVYDRILRLAREVCHGKVVSVLEGGYSLRWVGRIGGEIVCKLSGESCGVSDKRPMPNVGVSRQGEKAIREVRKIQGPYWKIK